MENDLKDRLKSAKGSSAPTTYWRKFQAAINKRYDEIFIFFQI